MLVEIKSDVFSIAKRLQAIDSGYKLFFNESKNKYELHNKNQYGCSYCLTFPYPFIDERMLLYALKTRSKNKDKIFEELEKENQKIEEREIKNTKEKIKNILGEIK